MSEHAKVIGLTYYEYGATVGRSRDQVFQAFKALEPSLTEPIDLEAKIDAGSTAQQVVEWIRDMPMST